MSTPLPDLLPSQTSPGYVDAPSTSIEPLPDARKRLPGPSVKQLVRSLSNKYAAVTSPLAKKKKNAGNNLPADGKHLASLKKMKTNAATSFMPLTPPNASKRQPLAEVQGTTPAQMVKKLLDTKERPSSVNSQEPFSSQATPAGVHRFGSSVFTSSQALDLSVKDKTLCTLQKQIIEKASGRSHQLEKHSQKEIASKQARRLSQVQRNEQKLTERNKKCELELQQLQDLFTMKDEEAESIRMAGLMLKQLCLKQDEEIKTLKAVFPATLKETAQLRELCERQERELAQARVAIPTLQEQVAALAEQFKCLAEDVAQVKANKQARLGSTEGKDSQLHGAEVTSSSCSGSTVTIEQSPISSGHIDFLGRQRKGFNIVPSEEKLQSGAGGCEATSSSCSGSTVTVEQSEMPLEHRNIPGRRRKGLSIVPSEENVLKGDVKKSGKEFMTDKEIRETLQQLSHVAEKEQAVLQERCANVFKDLRSSSSRFASLESLKSMLICTSPHLYTDTLENERSDNWNLKPT